MSVNAPDTPEGHDGRERVARTILDAMVGATAVVADRAPGGWPDFLIPPLPAIALGGMSFGHSITAVFAYPPAAERPIDAYRAFLERDGWTRQEEFMSGGFVPTDVAMRRNTSLVTLRGTTPAEQSVVVSLEPYQERPSPSTMRHVHLDTIDIPRLEAPPGVRLVSGGGGGGGDRTYRHARLTTDLTPAELLPLYVARLVAVRWTTRELYVTASAATQWVEAPDAKGRVWRGMLAVYMNGVGREVFLFMAKGME